jgi:RimJ/RimL family protein N-acetyltransferase
MLLRPITGGDLRRVLAATPAGAIGSVSADCYRAGLADRQYRPEWTWVAEEDGEILARAIWWGFSDAEHPMALDGVDVRTSVLGRAGLAARLLAAGHQAFRTAGAPRPPEFDLDLPNGWRTDPAVIRSLGWRRRAASLAGLTEELERLRYTWSPEAGVPGRSTRLMFRAEPEDGVFLDAFRRVAVGSLDVTTRRNVAALGADRQAREDMQIYLSLPGDRTWWRLAFTHDGALAGLAIPSRNAQGAAVGYLGVVPELRGHHYIDDILAEITRFHAEAGARRIVAATDRTNVPMAAAFERAGYRVYGIRLVLSAPDRWP